MHDHHRHHDHDKHEGHSPNIFKQKFWISLALSIPALLFSETVQEWFGVQWAFTGSQYIPAIFGVAIFLYGGTVFLKGAKAELAGRQPGMMTLISMAITVAFTYSAASTFGLVQGMDFWWELATLVTIMLLGHWLEMASIMHAQGALQELAKLLPDQAELLDKNGTHVVPVSQLKVGDVVLVRPGAAIPADGEVSEGTSEVNEAMITGESAPIAKQKGYMVVAGTVNGTGALTITVGRIGEHTALAGIMRLVAEAQSSKTKVQVIADKAAFYLTFIALGAAIATWIGWAIAGESAAFILERVVTVLVVACPHALGLAIPLVVAISTTTAAKNGLLIRQRPALENARNIDVVLFDKTGTLTEGNQSVVDVQAVKGEPVELLRLAAAIEQQAEHSIARAIVAAAAEQSLHIPKVTEFAALPGRGAKATIDGKVMYAGGPQLIAEQKIVIPASFLNDAKNKTTVFITDSKIVLGMIVIADAIRVESTEAVRALQNLGIEVAMVTGDGKNVAASVAKELNITTYFAEVLPEHKANTVRQLQATGKKIAMIGDGVNDAPALTQADIGIAIGAGTDVAIESADVVLASSDPRGVAAMIKLSRRTYQKMVQNLLWATAYNAIAIPLSAGVLAAWGIIVSPAVGAVLMSISTVVVAANAQLLRRGSQ